MARFCAQKEGRTLRLFGDLHGGTNLAALDNLLDPQTVLDCSNIRRVGWDGLHHLYQKLLQEAAGIHVINMPHQMYRYWRLLDRNEQFFHLENVEVPTFVEAEAFSGSVWVDPENISKDRPNHVFAKTADHQFIFDAICFLQPSQFRAPLLGQVQEQVQQEQVQQNPINKPKTTLPKTSLPNHWCQNNLEQIEFLYRYLTYFGNTISLCCNTAEDIEANLVGVIEKLGTFETGMQTLSDFLAWQIPEQKHQQLADFVQKECKEYLIYLHGVDQETHRLQRQVQLLCQDEALDSPESEREVKAIWQRFAAVSCSVHNITGLLEQTAVTVGGYIPDTQYLSGLEQRLQSLTDADFTAEQLETVRDAFCIMDPLSADSWSDTALELWPELQQLKIDAEDLVVNMQGFDLIRQILEHRIEESNVLDAYARALNALSSDQNAASQEDHMTWQSARDTLNQMVQKRLITRQERSAAQFFFPNMNIQEREIDPGGMMFF